MQGALQIMVLSEQPSFVISPVNLSKFLVLFVFSDEKCVMEDMADVFICIYDRQNFIWR